MALNGLHMLPFRGMAVVPQLSWKEFIFCFCSYCSSLKDWKWRQRRLLLWWLSRRSCFNTGYYSSFQTIRFVSIPEKPQINLAQKSENFYDISAHVLARGRGCGESNVIRAYRHALLSMEMGSSSARFIDWCSYYILEKVVHSDNQDKINWFCVS